MQVGISAFRDRPEQNDFSRRQIRKDGDERPHLLGDRSDYCPSRPVVLRYFLRNLQLCLEFCGDIHNRSCDVGRLNGQQWMEMTWGSGNIM